MDERSIRAFRPRARPGGEQLPPFLRIQHRNVFDAAVEVIADTEQEGVQMGRDTFRGRLVDRMGVVVEANDDTRRREYLHRHRIVREAIDLDGRRLVVSPSREGIDRVFAVEDHDGVEQWHARRRVTALLDDRQGRLFVLPDGDLLTADLPQPGRDLESVVKTHPNRQRIDEQADDIIGVLDGPHPRGASGAEDDVLQSCIATQQQAPRRLKQGVQGEAVVRRELAQRFTGLGIDVEGLHAPTAGLSFDERRGQGRCDRTRFVKTPEKRAPVG